MAGNAKPNILNLGNEGIIKFLEYNDQSRFDKIETLIDGGINKHSKHGVLLYETSPIITFEIYQKSNIYAYGNSYSDSGGYTPQSVDLYIKNNGKYKLLKKRIATKSDEWYLLFENLESGIYQIKCTSSYTMFTEWYIENLERYKFLVKQNNKYYSIDNNYQQLGSPKNNLELESWYNKYGTKDTNIITQTLDNKKISMSKELNTQISETEFELDANEILNNIEIVEENIEDKAIRYSCENYKIYDMLEDEFEICMVTDKEEVI